MTIRGKSDSQLDAEAAVRAMLNRGRSADPLTEWRAAAFGEVPSRLHQKPTAELGVDLGKQLTDYLDASFPVSPHNDRLGITGHFPVHDALLLWQRECRRRHRSWWDHPNGRPICYEIAVAVIEHQCSLAWAGERAGISALRAERHLLAAVTWMRRRQERWLENVGMSAGHDPEYCRVCRGEAA